MHAVREPSIVPVVITNGLLGARERLADRLDGAADRRRRALEVAREREVVLEREVDHAIGGLGRRSQAVEIIEAAAPHLCPGRGERIGRGIRASEPDDLMARAESSRTTAEPIRPDAPVTNTRMRKPPVMAVLSADHVARTA